MLGSHPLKDYMKTLIEVVEHGITGSKCSIIWLDSRSFLASHWGTNTLNEWMKESKLQLLDDDNTLTSTGV